MPQTVEVRLQYLLGLCALAARRVPGEGWAEVQPLLAQIEGATCGSREARRALKKLWIALLKRASSVAIDAPEALWKTWRVQRLAAIWFRVLGAPGLYRVYLQLGFGSASTVPVVPPVSDGAESEL